MHAALFVAGNLLALGVSAQAAEMLLAGREPWRRLLAALAGLPVVVLLVVEALGAVGRLTPTAAAGTMGLVFVALTVIRRGRIAGLLPARDDTRRDGLWGGAPPGPLWPLPLAAAGASWLYIAASTCFKGTRLGMDDLSYHAAGPAQWLLDQRISLAPFNYHAYYPFNAESLSLWFMLPVHSDVFASLAGLYWATLGVVAITALGLALGRSRSEAVLPAAVALVPPVVIHQLTGTFCAVDFAGPAAILAGLALMAPAAGDKTPRMRDALLGGLMVGWAAGAKASLLAISVVPLIWLVARALPRRKWCLPVAYVVSGLAAGGFWYARNWLVTGNPIFPADLGPFAGPMDAGAREYLSLKHWIVAPDADWRRWWYIASSHLLWPLLPGLAALGGWIAGAAAVVRRARREATGDGALLRLV
ncbi:MAG: hypothetical protein J7M38_13955, partial [Armatimonadetes bacterium]|nr:hypothetical protein [Armatimonadota bacterium]